MSKVRESLRADRHRMAVRIQEALTGAQDGIDNDDCREIIDWCATIQIVSAKLISSTMLDIRNRED